MLKERVNIGIDDTDHIVFFCPNCNHPLKVKEVKTLKVPVDMYGNEDKCTYLTFSCSNKECDKDGLKRYHKKFYWDHKKHNYRGVYYCRFRTDGINGTDYYNKFKDILKCHT